MRHREPGRALPGPKLKVEDHPFVQGLDREFVTRAVRSAVERTYEAGDTLFQEGDPAEEFILVFHGKVALEVATADQPRLTIQTVGPGEVLGWSWLAAPYRWRFDGRALKPTLTLALSAAVLKEAFEERPKDGYQFLLRLVPVIADRLEMALIQVLDVHGA